MSLDLSSLVAPWMQQSFSPSDYGGAANLGASLLAMSGPSRMPMSNMQRLGLALQGAQKTGLQNAAARQQIAGGTINTEMALQRMPGLAAYYQMLARLANGTNQGAPGSGLPAQSGAPQGMPQGATQRQMTGSPASGALPSPVNAGGAAAAPPPGASTSPGGMASAGSPYGPDPNQWLTAGMVGAGMGAPGANSIITGADTMMRYDPRTQNALASAKSKPAVDLQLLRSAQAAGNVQMAQLAYNSLLQDTGALQVSRNGIRQWLDPTTGKWSMVDPVNGTGMSGNQVYAMSGAPQALGTIAGTKAAYAKRAELGAEAAPLGTGGMPGGGLPPYSVAGAVARARAAASAPQGQSGLLGQLPPVGARQEVDWQGDRAEATSKLQENWAEASRNAVVANNALLQQEVEARQANLGPAAPARMYFEKMLAGMGQSLNMPPPKELAKYQEVDKYTFQIAAAQAKALGSREAAQVVGWAIQNNPNKEMVGSAFYWLNGALRAMNQYTVDKNLAIQQAGPNGTDMAALWDKRIDPTIWNMTMSPIAAQKLSAVVPIAKIRDAYGVMDPTEQQALVKNLPASVLKQLAGAQ